MLIFCNGMPRSASTWSFNVAMELLRRTRPAERIHGGYEPDENVAKFLATAPADAVHIILKCHSLDAIGLALTRAGAAKVIYTWRDPADAIVSFQTMFSADFEEAFASIASSLELMRFHRRHGNALILEYEEITGKPVESVGRLAAYLGLEACAELIAEIAAQSSIERMRDKAEQLAAVIERDRLVQHHQTVYDKETLLHVNHIRDGSSGYGRARLTAEQWDRIAELRQRL